jgi:hypothetical protein
MDTTIPRIVVTGYIKVTPKDREAFVKMLQAHVPRVRRKHGCIACRKSNPDILMMQPAQYRSTIDVPCPLNSARYWRILLHG